MPPKARKTLKAKVPPTARTPKLLGERDDDTVISAPGTNDINLVVEHQKRRFRELDRILDGNTGVNVIIAKGPSDPLHSLGTGIAKTSWPTGPEYTAMIGNLDSLVRELSAKHGPRITFDAVGEKAKFDLAGGTGFCQSDPLKQPSQNLIHVWGANAGNFNLPDGAPITGSGQADCFTIQKPGVFGISTMPDGGASLLANSNYNSGFSASAPLVDINKRRRDFHVAINARIRDRSLIVGSLNIPGDQQIVWPDEIKNSRIIETSGNANDCMIHSILTQIFGDFRHLDDPGKNNVAEYIRRDYFPTLNMLKDYKEVVPVGYDFINILRGTEFLTDTELDIISAYYDIPVLVIATKPFHPSVVPDIAVNQVREFNEKNNIDPAIVFHYNGTNHYSALEVKLISGWIDFTITNILFQQIIRDYVTKGTTVIDCKFKENDKVYIISDPLKIQHTVIKRMFDTSTVGTDVKKCTMIKLEDNSLHAPSELSFDVSKTTALTPPEIIELGRKSYKKLSGLDASRVDTAFKGAIKFWFSTMPEFSSCDSLKDFLTDGSSELLKEETVDYWNIMNAYLQLIKEPDDEKKWADVDAQYGKLAEARRLTVFNKGIERYDKGLMRGGLRPERVSTNIFNKSLIANDDIEIAKFDRAISRTEKKIKDEIDYFDTKYALDRVGKPPSSKDKGYVDELLDEAQKQEKEKSKYIEDIAHPEHQFEKLLNKFKTESQLISWLEKAKTENIKFTAESRKANQKVKTLSTIKETIDNCVKNMKKSLNYKCENIMQYRTILDKSKELETKQNTILELSAFMVDPGRGVDNARDAMVEIGIDSPSNGLKTYFAGLKFPSSEDLSDLLATGNLTKIIDAMNNEIVPAIKELSENPLLTKITLIKNEINNMKKMGHLQSFIKIRLDAIKSVPQLTAFIERIFADNKFFETYKEITKKIEFLNSILTTKSSAPILSEILRKRQETGDIREEIKDTLEELNEAKQTPVNVSKCIEDYKQVISKENADLEKELDRIDTVTEDYLKKVPQAIDEIKNQIKVNLNQGGPGGQGQGQGNKNYSTMTKEDLLKEKEGEKRGIDNLRARQNDSRTNEKEKNKIKNQIKTKEDAIRNIDRELDKRNNAPKSGGGSQAYAHSTRRYIKP